MTLFKVEWLVFKNGFTHTASIPWRHNWVRWRLKSPASRLFAQLFIQARIKKTSKLHVTGIGAGNSPVTGEFPAQMASNAVNVSIWWRHHAIASINYFAKFLSCPKYFIQLFVTKKRNNNIEQKWHSCKIALPKLDIIIVNMTMAEFIEIFISAELLIVTRDFDRG